MKPKQLNGVELSGKAYNDLIGSYVEAINSGEVPNIENSWQRVCRAQCMDAMYKAVALFD